MLSNQCFCILRNDLGKHSMSINYLIISVQALQLSEDFGALQGNILQNIIIVEIQVHQNNDLICLNVNGSFS